LNLPFYALFPQVIVVALFLSGAPMKEGNPVYEANILTGLPAFPISLGLRSISS